MKKFLAIMICAVMLVSAMSVLAVPAGAISANDMQDGHQLLLGSIKVNGSAPVCDGEVLPGEYSSEYVINRDSESFLCPEGMKSEYIKFYVTHDDEFVYMAAIVQEDGYAYKGQYSTYSSFFMCFGLNTKDPSMFAAMDRMGMTLSLNNETDADGNHTLFAGNGWYNYTVKSDGSNQTSWSYMGPVMPEKCFKRGVDENGNKVTVYEFKLSKEVLLQAFGEVGVTTMPDLCYLTIMHTEHTDDGTKLGQSKYCDNFEDGDPRKVEFLIQDGWSASFVPHLLGFYDTAADKISAVSAFEEARLAVLNASQTTVPDDTTAAPADDSTTADDNTTTPAPDDDTTPAPVDNETTPDAASDTTPAPADDKTNAPDSETKAPDTDKKTGCGSISVAAVAAMIVTAIGTALVIKKK